MTIEQVRQDIKTGKCKAIYMCSESLWWTHVEGDLIDSTSLAMNWGKKVTTPTCSPLGFPLVVNKDPKKWLATTEHFTTKFGKHRLAALMKAHHQNNKKHFYNKWKRYNDLIDLERGLKGLKIA